ncbi:hypothetical protein JTB14_032051 [Gonioctena quinquepunctata]|nr:hypothetical protein JTB14_032051 [Gonioctena quinquepunctata]
MGKWAKFPLKKPEREWFKQEIFEIDSTEMKKEFIAVTLQIQESDFLPAIKRFSSWFRLIRTTAWLLRILHIKKRISDPHIKKLPSELLPEEIHMAENVWTKNIQKKRFRRRN